MTELQDYFDDGDYGIGHSILNVLLDEQRYYRAIYIVRQFGKKQLGSKHFEIATDMALHASRKIDSADSLGEVSKLHYPKSLLPKAYQLSLSKGEIYRSRWSIPDSLPAPEHSTELSAGITDSDSEIELNTQKFQERLERLRNMPCTDFRTDEDWSQSHEGVWGGDETAINQTLVTDTQ